MYDSRIKTPQTHPDHHTVGNFFAAHSHRETGTAIWYCDSYDPAIGYWMTEVLYYAQPNQPIDPGDDYKRTNVSERAIGRTFHMIDPEGYCQWEGYGRIYRGNE